MSDRIWPAPLPWKAGHEYVEGVADGTYIAVRDADGVLVALLPMRGGVDAIAARIERAVNWEPLHKLAHSEARGWKRLAQVQAVVLLVVVLAGWLL